MMVHLWMSRCATQPEIASVSSHVMSGQLAGLPLYETMACYGSLVLVHAGDDFHSMEIARVTEDKQPRTLAVAHFYSSARPAILH